MTSPSNRRPSRRSSTTGAQTGTAQLIGPYGYGAPTSSPRASRLPYTIQFSNPSTHLDGRPDPDRQPARPQLRPPQLPAGRPPDRRPPGAHPRLGRLVPGRFRFHADQGLHPPRQRGDRRPVRHDHLAVAGDRPGDRRSGDGPGARAPASRQQRLGLRHLHRRAAGRRGDRDADRRPGEHPVRHLDAAGHQHRHQHGRLRGTHHDLDRRRRSRRAAPTTRCNGPPPTTTAARASRA